MEHNREVICRPRQTEPPPFQFADFSQSTSADKQPQIAMKPRDLSFIDDLFKRSSNVLPVFGVQLEKSKEVSGETLKDETISQVCHDNAYEMNPSTTSPSLLQKTVENDQLDHSHGQDVSSQDLMNVSGGKPEGQVGSPNTLQGMEQIKAQLSTPKHLRAIPSRSFSSQDANIQGNASQFTHTDQITVSSQMLNTKQDADFEGPCSSVTKMKTYISTPTLRIPGGLKDGRTLPLMGAYANQNNQTVNRKSSRADRTRRSTTGHCENPCYSKNLVTTIPRSQTSQQNQGTSHPSRSSFSTVQTQEQTKYISSSSNLPEKTMLREMRRLRAREQELLEELAESENACRQLKSRLSDCERTIDNFRQTTQEQHINIINMEQRKVDNASLIAKLQQAYLDSSTSLECLRQESLVMKESLGTYNSNLVEAKDEVLVMRADMASALTNFQETQDKRTSLVAIIKEVQLELEKETLRATYLQATCDRNAGMMSEDRDRITELSTQVSDLLKIQVASQTEPETAIRMQGQVHCLKEEFRNVAQRTEDSIKKGVDDLQTAFQTLQHDLAKSITFRPLWAKSEFEAVAHQHESYANKLDNYHEIQKTVLLCLQSSHDQLLKENRDSQEARRREDLSLELCGDSLRELRSEFVQYMESQNRILESLSSGQERLAHARTENERNEQTAVQEHLEAKNQKIIELQDKHQSAMQEITKIKRDAENNVCDVRESMKAAFATELSSAEERWQRIKLHELMQLENQIKAQTSKIARLEAEITCLRDQAIIENSVPSTELCRLTRQRQHDPPMQMNSKQSDTIEVTNMLVVAEAQTTPSNTDTAQAQIVERYHCASIRQCSTPESGAATCHSHLSTSNILTEKVGRNTAKQFANISRSSDSFEVDDPNDLDFVHDSPPPERSEHSKKRSSAQDKKRRSLPVDLVRLAQDNSVEASVSTSVSPRRALQHRDSKVNRVRGGPSRPSYKKRRSN